MSYRKYKRAVGGWRYRRTPSLEAAKADDEYDNTTLFEFFACPLLRRGCLWAILEGPTTRVITLARTVIRSLAQGIFSMRAWLTLSERSPEAR
jgi:hypothetical protein